MVSTETVTRPISVESLGVVLMQPRGARTASVLVPHPGLTQRSLIEDMRTSRNNPHSTSDRLGNRPDMVELW
jgi:hypothetical protein